MVMVHQVIHIEYINPNVDTVAFTCILSDNNDNTVIFVTKFDNIGVYEYVLSTSGRMVLKF